MKKTNVPLWTPEFIGYGISSSVFYVVQYIMVAALPIVIATVFHGSAFDAGMTMTCFQIGCILSRPFAGELIDRLNKKKMLFFTTGLFFVITALFNFSPSIEYLFVYRFFQGVLFAIGTTAVATVAVLILPKQRKGEGIGYFAMFVNIAMVVGPFCGLLILDVAGAQTLFLFLAIIGLIGFYAANRKPLPASISAPPPQVQHKKWSIERFIERQALPWAVMGLFVSFIYSGILVFIPIMMTQLGIGTMASYFFVIFAAVIVITRPIVGRVYDFYGSAYLIYPGYLFFIVGIMMLAYADSTFSILLTAPILGLGYGAIAPAFQTLSVESSPMHRAGSATSTYFFFFDIGIGIGAVLLSFIADHYGFSGMYWLNAIVAIVALLLYHFVIRKKAKVQLNQVH